MIKICQKRAICQKKVFFCFYLWFSLFLLGCAGHKGFITDIQNKTVLINRINYNCQKIKDLSGHINLDIKIGNKRIIQKGYFFHKTPDLLKINFMGWFGIPRAVFLMNQRIKIYFYGKGSVFDIEEGKIPFLNFKQKISLDGFEILGEDGRNYIFYKENKKIWVDKNNKILVPHKIRVQVFSCQQLGQEFPWFTETIGPRDIKKIDMLLYLKKLSINKGLNEEIFNLSQ
jgi:hypothetical protein